jgi:hypothetical protein
MISYHILSQSIVWKVDRTWELTLVAHNIVSLELKSYCRIKILYAISQCLCGLFYKTIFKQGLNYFGGDYRQIRDLLHILFWYGRRKPWSITCSFHISSCIIFEWKWMVGQGCFIVFSADRRMCASLLSIWIDYQMKEN